MLTVRFDLNKLENYKRVRKVVCKNHEVFLFQSCASAVSVTSVAHFHFIKRGIITTDFARLFFSLIKKNPGMLNYVVYDSHIQQWRLFIFGLMKKAILIIHR